jgi:hypothetical protein
MAPAPFAADLETQARKLHVKLQGELSDAPIVGYGTCSKSKTSAPVGRACDKLPHSIPASLQKFNSAASAP